MEVVHLDSQPTSDLTPSYTSVHDPLFPSSDNLQTSDSNDAKVTPFFGLSQGNSITMDTPVNKVTEVVQLESLNSIIEKSNFYFQEGLRHHNEGHFQEAIDKYSECLSLKIPILGKEHVEIALVSNNIGTSLECLGRYEEAYKHHEMALFIYEKISGHELNVATCYSNMASILSRFGKFNEALKCYEQTLKIRWSMLGNDHITVATCLANIGSVYLNMGNDGPALSFQNKALEIRKKHLTEDHILLASSYNNIAAIYSRQGKYDQAMELYREALNIRIRNYGENHFEVGSSYAHIGSVLFAQEKTDQALVLYKKALNIRVNWLGPNHPSVGTCYNNLGLAYEKLGQSEKSLECCYKALEITQESFGEEHPEVAIVYNNIGKSMLSLGESKTALEVLKKALWIYSQSEEESAEKAVCLNNIASAYLVLGDRETSLEYYKEALNIRLQGSGQYDVETAGLYIHVGNLYYEDKKFSEAQIHFEKALEIYTRNKKTNLSVVMELYGKISQIQGTKQKNDVISETHFNSKLKLFNKNVENKSEMIPKSVASSISHSKDGIGRKKMMKEGKENAGLDLRR